MELLADSYESVLEIGARYAALTKDRQQRANPDFGVIGDGNRDRAAVNGALHDHVTAATPNFDESARSQQCADFAARKDAKLRQP
jgi:hypothetical protein